MKNVFRQNQLYTFLLYCNSHGLTKEILDCGAGGNLPPLALFVEHGYKTHGIEISDTQIERATEFARKNELDLNIIKGDMRELPFEDESLSYVFSYNTIFHLSKADIAKAINEVKRVLKPDGLFFVNFVSDKDMRYGEGEQVGDGEYMQSEGDGLVLHSYHKNCEAESYFGGFKIIYKESRVREGFARSGEKVVLGFLDYIVEKKK